MKRTATLFAAFLIAALTGCADAGQMPAVGSSAPDFSLPDQNGKMVRLSDWRGRWVVLYFYPKDDTPGCTTEACSFRDDVRQLAALGAQVLGVSLDDSTSHAAFAGKYHLPFPLLADTQGSVAQSYGVLSNYLVIKLARRCTFLVDPQGRIARVYDSVDPARHSAEVIADLKQLAGR